MTAKEAIHRANIQSGKTMLNTPRVVSFKRPPIRQDRCAFCRRRLWLRELGSISVTCKRHKNKPINWRFYGIPFVLTDNPEDWTSTDNAGAIK